MNVLGIETSCDETGIAIYNDQKGIVVNDVYSQVDLHRDYGGVVPELASRDHIRRTLPMIHAALTKAELSPDQINSVAYTAGPGLIGALLVGASVAKSLAFAWQIPALGIHHMDGDVAALNGIFGPLDTEKLHRVRHPSFLANAGGVDQDIGMPLPFILDFDGHVHRVARGSGNGADNHAFGLSEGIDDARLSDVGAPNDR